MDGTTEAPLVVTIHTSRGSGTRWFGAIVVVLSILLAVAALVTFFRFFAFGIRPSIRWLAITGLMAVCWVQFGLLFLICRTSLPKGKWTLDLVGIHFEPIQGTSQYLAWSDVESLSVTRAGIRFSGKGIDIVLPLAPLGADVCGWHR